MARHHRTIIVSACDNTSPGGPYRTVGALLYEASTRLLAFVYAEHYEGPPLDPRLLNYRRGVRNFLLPASGTLPSVFRRLLPWRVQKRLAEVHPELAGAPPAAYLPYLPLSEQGGLRFEPAEFVELDLDILSAQLDSAELQALPLARRFIGTVTGFAQDLDGAYTGRPQGQFELRSSEHLDRVRLAAVDQDGREWLVKIPDTHHGAPDDVALEATVLRTLRSASFDVPESHIYRLVNGQTMLQLDRFDISNGRHLHTVSLSELLPAEHATYRAVGHTVSKSSVDWRADQRRLAEAVVADATFNVVDNHLGNLSLLAAEHGYRLSPLYDRMPSSRAAQFATRLSGGSLELTNPVALARLADETQVPIELLADATKRLHNSVAMTMATHAAKTHLTEQGWRRLTTAIAVHQPNLAAALPGAAATSPSTSGPTPSSH